MSTFDRIRQHKRLYPDANQAVVHTIDLHTAGEPLRVILDGFPELPGSDVLTRRNRCKKDFDHLRTSLMWEPRGHADMYGCVLTPPNDPTADFGIVFMHNDGYSTMCGHAIIAITRLADALGWKDRQDNGELQLVIDTPCGRIRSSLHEQNQPFPIHFLGVPSFVVTSNEKLEIPGVGRIYYDLAFGGAFYAYVDADQLSLDLEPGNYREIITRGMQIKNLVKAQNQSIRHPFESELSFLYGTIFISEQASGHAESRNVCVFADGEVDRSPTGSGASGRMAIHYHRNQIDIRQKMTIESIIGTTFRASVDSVEDYGPYQAVIPKVEGDASITGEHTFIIDSSDPLHTGFFLR
ncbi:MAG: proline racemase family protein [Saprospiraceae bacterium]|nr:proline racemase family protein [Saprospiraceae bacterium]